MTNNFTALHDKITFGVESSIELNKYVHDKRHVNCLFNVVPAILSIDLQTEPVGDNDRLVDNKEQSHNFPSGFACRVWVEEK